MTRKGDKGILTPEHRKNISIGRLKSPKVKAWKEACHETVPYDIGKW
jgi:hypothetical protein